jgi:hypothetical protein
MGSFDVACSVSRITINPGDPVAYFPLEPYKYAYEIEAANNMLIYPWCYYVPITLPIFGEYFDYGYIDEIEKNNSKTAIKAIEKHFKESIRCVVGGEGELPCPGMFVHRDIYQTLVDNQIDDWGKTELKDDDGYGKPSRKLLSKRYNDVREALKKRKAIPKKLDHKDKWKSEFDIPMADYKIDEVEREFGFRDFKTFQKIYRPYIHRGWLRNQLIDFLYFNYSLNYANVHFFPAQNGYQSGNHYGNIIVHQKAVEILSRKIEEIEKYKNEE